MGCGSLLAWIVVIGVAAGVLVQIFDRQRRGGGPSSTHREGSSTRTSRPVRSRSNTELDALSKMELAFVGSPSRATVRSKMDAAFRRFRVPINEENYEKYGSVLVRLRKEIGPSEMEMLIFVIALGDEYNKIELGEAMALAAATLHSMVR